MYTVTISRFNPESNKQFEQTYKVMPEDISGNMLLDILESIKAHQDSSLSFRRSCGGGVCGSDGMNINGKNGLACQTPINELPQKITIRPLPGLPIERDLIVDMTRFYKHYETTEPYLQNSELPEDGLERIQSPEQRALLDGLYECILCACCTTSCPSFWWNPEKFLGPAALLTLYRFVADSRDTATGKRLKELNDLYSLYRCRGIMNCTTVCPKGLNPTHAISKLRKEEISTLTNSCKGKGDEKTS